MKIGRIISIVVLTTLIAPAVFAFTWFVTSLVGFPLGSVWFLIGLAILSGRSRGGQFL